MGCASARAGFGCAGSVVGSSRAFICAAFSSASSVCSFMGSARRGRSTVVGRAAGPDRARSRPVAGRAGTILGIAPGRRAAQAGRCPRTVVGSAAGRRGQARGHAGNIVEPAGAVVGPA
ncbi:MAG: hypothetical protein PVSMB3_03270 [Candidatus Dormibacteraceae bacterium]